MATTDLLHKDLTDPQLHEPKGLTTAEENTVYVADGEGHGTWKAIGFKEIDFVKGPVTAPVTEEMLEVNPVDYNLLTQPVDGTVQDSYRVGSDEAFKQCDKNVKEVGVEVTELRLELIKAFNNIKALQKVVEELRAALLTSGIIIEG